jgi:hypothetical protein
MQRGHHISIWACVCLAWVVFVGNASGQQATYRLHKETSTINTTFDKLLVATPDASSVALTTALGGKAAGEYKIKEFETQSGVPGANGAIPSGSTVSFSLWMRKTANVGTVFPRAKIQLNSATGTLLCTATGSTALSTTVAKQTLNCITTANIPMTSTDRFYLWVGINLTATSSNSFNGELDIEGTANGNFDSQITVPLPLPAPSITSLTPSSGAIGSSIVVSGSNFGNSPGAITFNGTSATPTAWASSSISAPVPVGATSGPVVVTVAGQASAGITFTVTPPPAITTVNPTSVRNGSSVTITGSNFGSSQGSITFNGVTGSISSWSDTSIIAVVPTGATSGDVMVIAAGGVASNGVAVTVLPPPGISEFSPSSAAPGGAISILGANFGASQGSVKIGGVPLTINTWSDTVIRAVLPGYAVSGDVVVVTSDGGSTPGNFFPVVNSGGLWIDQVASGGSQSQPFSTAEANEVLLAFVSGGSTSPITSSSVTGAGLTWTLVQRTNAQLGTAEVWRAFSPSILTNASISVQLDTGDGSDANSLITVVSFVGADISGTNGSGAIGAIASANAASGAPAVTLTTTRPNALVLAVGDDPTGAMARVTGPNQGLVFQTVTSGGGCFPLGCTFGFAGPDTLWVQQIGTSIPASGTVVTLNDSTPTNDPYNMTAIEVLPAAGASAGPTITSLSVSSGPEGTSVTLNGTNFGGTQGTVTFNGVSATPSSWSATSIVVPVPTGASTGNVVVTANGQPSNGVRFIVTNAAGLAVDAIAQPAVPFSTSAGNEVLLAFVSVAPSNTSSDGTVSGGGLTWQLIQETSTQGGSAQIWRAFSPYLLSDISVDFTPSAVGGVDQFPPSYLITVVAFLGADSSAADGSAATGALGSTFSASGAPSASLVTTRNNSMVFGVGDDPTAGLARTLGPGQTLLAEFTQNCGRLCNSGNFNADLWVQQLNGSVANAGTTVTINDVAPTGDAYNLSIVEVRPSAAPVISNLSPLSGPIGTIVTVTGSNFGATQGTITFGGISGIPTSWSAGSVTVPVPNGVSLGPLSVVVTAGGASSNSASFTVTVPITITFSVSPAPNIAGWNNTDVTITYSCSGGVPSLQCPAAQTVTNEGIQTIHATAIDGIGASASVDVPLKIDKTGPIVTASVSPAPVQGVVTAPATVTFTCSDALSGIASCPASVQVTTAGATQQFSGTATDIAGNPSTASIALNVQLAPLSVVASASPSANAALWNNSPVTVSFQCSGGVPPVLCPPPQTVTTDGANQAISGSVSDAAGQTNSASATINLDRSPPLVSITSPADGAISPSASISVSGSANDGLSGLASVSCNGNPASLSAGNFTCPLQITQGSLQISVTATDAAGNSASTSTTSVLQGPKLSITTPTTLQLFNSKTITVSGAVDDPNATISVNGVSAANNGGSFTATGVILREGSNVVTATATNAGGAVGSTGVNLVVDTTPPIVTIDSPSNGAVLTSPQVYVTGLVNDLVPGTVNLAQVSVTINGVSAAVSNRSFMAEDVLLVPGQNVITAVATDRAGNTSQSSVTVTLVDANAQQHLLMVSGNGQSGLIGTVLPQPLLVQALNSAGQPMPNVPVTFAMNKSDGLLTAFPQQGRQITLQTDATGQASVLLQLGSRVGSGNNQVLVTSPGFVGQIMFCSTATVGSATQIHDIAGENQIGVVGQALPEPFVVVVFDSGGNPVSGVPVLFTVEQGGGTLDGNAAATKTTDSDGRASATLVLAQQEGVNNNVVSASFDQLTGSPAAFVASGATPHNPASTTVSGIVLDNANHPLVNVTASLQGMNLSALTNTDGRFTITNAPVGSQTLLVDGSTSTAAEPYPFLEFPLTTVAGQDNHLSGPIFLPEIDSDNSKVVGGDQDVTLTMKGVPGVVFTVFAHSATFPDGSKVGRLSVSQVHADKVPMPPPNGTAPTLFWTVQPPRVKFDPPMRVQIPNTDGLVPGAVTEIFCYNHDLEEFASSGTARVSEDGSVVISDPGSGVIVSGWGDAPPPPPPNSCASKCNCGVCIKGFCVPVIGGSSGDACDANDACTVNPKCNLLAVCTGDRKSISNVRVSADNKLDSSLQPDVTSVNADVMFEANATTSNCSQVHYQWDFDDGSPQVEGGATITHKYTVAGKHFPQVTVKCDSCNSSFTSLPVEVVAAEIKTITATVPHTAKVNSTSPATPFPDDQFVSSTDQQNMADPFTLPRIIGFKTLCETNPKLEDTPELNDYIKWRVDRNPADTIQAGVPTLAASRETATWGTDVEGSFFISCFIDHNQDLELQDSESRKVLNLAVVGIHPSNILPAVHPAEIAQVPGNANNQITITTGVFDATMANAAHAAVFVSAQVTLVGGGPDQSIGVDKIHPLFTQNFRNDTYASRYDTGTSLREAFAANPPAPNPVCAPSTVGLMAFPVLDGDTAFPNGGNQVTSVCCHKETPQIGTARIIQWSDSPGFSNPISFPCGAGTLKSVSGGNDFSVLMLAYSDDAVHAYSMNARVDWSVNLDGTVSLVNGQFTWAPGPGTGEPAPLWNPNGFNATADGAGVMIYGPTSIGAGSLVFDGRPQ